MAIIRFSDQPVFRNPWADFERMRRDFETMFRGGGEGVAPGPTVFPALNLSEDENNIYVRAEIPGVPPELLDLSVEGDTLIIKGERKELMLEEGSSCHRREIESGHFSRAMTLPTRVKAEAVSATSKNGILLITLPKAEEVKPRRITIKTS